MYHILKTCSCCQISYFEAFWSALSFCLSCHFQYFGSKVSFLCLLCWLAWKSFPRLLSNLDSFILKSDEISVSFPDTHDGFWVNEILLIRRIFRPGLIIYSWRCIRLLFVKVWVYRFFNFGGRQTDMVRTFEHTFIASKASGMIWVNFFFRIKFQHALNDYNQRLLSFFTDFDVGLIVLIFLF